jgi:hypothetical protein
MIGFAVFSSSRFDGIIGVGLDLAPLAGSIFQFQKI